MACVRVMSGATVERTCRTFGTTTVELGELRDWLDGNGCTEVAMEATGVYWKPVWNILSDGRFDLILANAAHIKAVPGPQDGHQRRDVDRRPGGLRFDPTELRARGEAS